MISYGYLRYAFYTTNLVKLAGGCRDLRVVTQCQDPFWTLIFYVAYSLSVLELHPQSPAAPKLKSDSAKITFEDIRTISKSKEEANRKI
jgi:hypothetical protein